MFSSSLITIGKAGLGILLLVSCWMGIRFFIWKSLYHPGRVILTNPSHVGLEYEDIEFVSSDAVSLHGWWIPHSEARGTLIYCHGNAGNIGDRVYLLEGLRSLKLNIFFFDYRGYGQSKGLPTEQGIYRDAHAAFEVVRARHGDDDAPPVLVYGRSLGAAVAIEIAKRKTVKGLIIEGAFTSLDDIAGHYYPGLPVHWFSGNGYLNAQRLTELGIPKLIAHSSDDEVIPFKMGESLFSGAAEPKTFLKLAGTHNDAAWETTPNYLSALTRFADGVLK